MRCFIFIVLFFPSKVILGQGVETQTNLQQLGATNDPTQVVRQFDSRYQGIKGTPLLWDDYVSGTIKFKDGRTFRVSYVNFDLVDDSFVYKSSRNDKVLVLKNVEYFRTDSVSCKGIFCFLKFFALSAQTAPSGYFSVIAEGKNTFLCKLYKTILKADYKGAYSAGQNADRFVEERQFFMVDSIGTVRRFKPSQKSISELFFKNRDVVKRLVNEKNYNLKNDTDLKKLLESLTNQ